jgi:hypothetical protein
MMVDESKSKVLLSHQHSCLCDLDVMTFLSSKAIYACRDGNGKRTNMEFKLISLIFKGTNSFKASPS